ncbi:HAD family hydrolase [Pseudoxanthomonas mexicana]|uniref:HAD family hydrolase n=1 Tax=Pseudoxanthomonas mexicana TaxID=128785 RepID=UPI00398B3DE9
MNASPIPAPYLDPQLPALLARLSAPRKALFLDRDGVINVDRGYVHTAEETEWLPGIFELVAGALVRGYLPIVVTNQAGIARGYYDEQGFLRYTAWVHDQFRLRGAPLAATFHCPHHPRFGTMRQCPCRKPEPGMLLAARDLFALDMQASELLGDKPGDLQAAAAAGVGRRTLVSGALPAHGCP